MGAPRAHMLTPTSPNSLRTQTQPGHPLTAGKGTRHHPSQPRSHTHMEAITKVPKAQGPAPEHKGKKKHQTKNNPRSQHLLGVPVVRSGRGDSSKHGSGSRNRPEREGGRARELLT
ncbi:hypothetical protein PVAP13_4KG317205 [Panicum virgatum]|uniref:Uncharacterized protein n=1 Tax=Panicum virgatum TaxID=38727 RepID=A0A8T0TUM7_PANVG|nr:hypothetical protein PVAP13_4KG317205 [Panicum virgatum]